MEELVQEILNKMNKIEIKLDENFRELKQELIGNCGKINLCFQEMSEELIETRREMQNNQVEYGVNTKSLLNSLEEFREEIIREIRQDVREKKIIREETFQEKTEQNSRRVGESLGNVELKQCQNSIEKCDEEQVLQRTQSEIPSEEKCSERKCFVKLICELTPMNTQIDCKVNNINENEVQKENNFYVFRIKNMSVRVKEKFVRNYKTFEMIKHTNCWKNVCKPYVRTWKKERKE